MTQVDSAVAKVQPIGGQCKAGAAISRCRTDLFSGASSESTAPQTVTATTVQSLLEENIRNGKASRILVVIMAGKSIDPVVDPARNIAGGGVKLISVGIGNPCYQNQLLNMAFTSSHVLCPTSLTKETENTADVIALILDILGLKSKCEHVLLLYSLR